MLHHDCMRRAADSSLKYGILLCIEKKNNDG